MHAWPRTGLVSFSWERHTRYSWARVIITSRQSSSSPSPAVTTPYEVHYIYRSVKSLPPHPWPQVHPRACLYIPQFPLKKQSAWTKLKFLSFLFFSFLSFRLRVHPSCVKRKFKSISSFHITSHYIQTQTRILPIASVV